MMGLILAILFALGSSNPTKQITFKSLNIESKIRLRYAITEVTSVLENPSGVGREVNFTMILPEDAFISNFTMNVNGILEIAEVKEKQEAKKKYSKAKTLGLSSGLIHRNSNEFKVSTFVEEGKNAEFYLKYEELLQQSDSNYHHDIKIFPDGEVEDIRVMVEIDESLPLANLKVPPLKATDNLQVEGSIPPFETEPDATIDHQPGTSKATIEYKPSEAKSGTLSIQYDVDRKKHVNEIQVIDGHFVHFFNPNLFRKLPVHVAFVLDVSGSMWGQKIEQLKDAMYEILDDLEDYDYFSLIPFNSYVTPWNQKAGSLPQGTFRNIVSYKDKAMNFINSLQAGGGTALNQALLTGLRTLTATKSSDKLPKDTSSMMIFLTDGQPTDETNKTVILDNVRIENYNNFPMFGLAFGQDADYDFMKKLSENTGSFARRIYDDSDAYLQLDNFFKQISHPVLKNMDFTYQGVEETSKTTLAQVFKGSEARVVGKLDPAASALNITVTGDNMLGRDGYKASATICTNQVSNSCNQPNPVTYSLPSGFMKRYFAYTTIKELISFGDKESMKKALDLSLENNFVTDLTSLVVTSLDSSFTLNQTLYKQTEKEEVSHWIGGGPVIVKEPECSLILFSEQRFRGESVQIVSDSSDLSAFGFNDRVSSLKVVGTSETCSWTLYSGTDFTGKQIVVSKGKNFARPSSLRQLLKKAKSVKMN